MPLSLSALDARCEAQTLTYDWRQTALYALGVGLGREDLDYLYEGRGPKVLPSFAVVPGYPVIDRLFQAVDGNMLGVVHASQSFRFHKPFAPAATVTTEGGVRGIYDLKRMAQVVFGTETRAEDGSLICEGEWTMIYRLDGNFGGDAPPRRAKDAVPDSPAQHSDSIATTPNQALLYRLLGDSNPLHADPETAAKAGFDQPILHGLCTLGAMTASVVRTACGGDPAKLKAISGQFRKPVFPGDTLRTEAWQGEGGQWVLRGSVPSRDDEVVVSHAHAELSP